MTVTQIEQLINSTKNDIILENENIDRMKLRLKLLKCQMGIDIIYILQKNKLFNEYADEDAQYDEEWYNIPYSVWYAVTAINREEIKVLNNYLEPYQGSIEYHDDFDFVSIRGSA